MVCPLIGKCRAFVYKKYYKVICSSDLWIACPLYFNQPRENEIQRKPKEWMSE